MDSGQWTVDSGRWRFSRMVGYAFFCLSLFTVHCSLFTAASAQEGPLDVAPPPLKVISKDERSRLDAETDPKDRTKLVLEMMNARLVVAEKMNTAQDHDAMFRELGAFQGLMDNGVEYLLKLDRSKGKVLDNLKRTEIAFRGFTTRVGTIHRDLPSRYEDYVRKLLKYIRDARTKASEPLFGDTVVPMRK